MERVWPQLTADDGGTRSRIAIDAHLATLRTPPVGRPWVAANMVASIDGGATRAGRSGSLAGAGDRAVFHALREVPDAILVGAATVRAERYHLPRPRPDGHRPRLVIISASLDLPADLPCLTERSVADRPLVLTVATSSLAARERLAELAEVVVVGDSTVEPQAALAALADRAVGVALCEGGPRILGQFVAADVVDEWFVTIGAVAVLGDAARIAVDPNSVERRFRLRSILHDGDDVFLAYERGARSEGMRIS